MQAKQEQLTAETTFIASAKVPDAGQGNASCSCIVFARDH